ncbi:unnamed protein product [Gongylonema pulchrum]|uniref:N-acetyltransferase domain-containing protein n=1 Tax=Gongylonema pulchrum TaxID=637853 RepID=A0A183EDN9_9BILA|nr:unnamed protein product [Gongylonema pulchrum]
MDRMACCGIHRRRSETASCEQCLSQFLFQMQPAGCILIDFVIVGDHCLVSSANAKLCTLNSESSPPERMYVALEQTPVIQGYGRETTARRLLRLVAISRSHRHGLKVYDYVPTWSHIVSNRRNAWEEKAKNTEARVQMHPSSKIAPEERPHWYNKANQTHNLWQNEANRLSRSGAGFGDATQTSYDYVHHGESRKSREEFGSQKGRTEYSTDDRPGGSYDGGFVSQTHYTTQAGRRTENGQWREGQYYSSYAASQKQQYKTEHGAPTPPGTYRSYPAAIPISPPQADSSSKQQQRQEQDQLTSGWQYQR